MMNDNCVSGIITKETPSQFLVSIDSEGDCKGCGMSSVCSSKTISLEKENLDKGLKVGARVNLEYHRVIQTSFIVYLLPMFFFFMGIFLSKWLLHIDNEVLLFVNAVLATAASFFLVHYINNHFGDSKYKVNVRPINLYK
ncbi:MAG: SoxR reducing system RseC family protein [Calditrichaceae bacterium]|jgi:positive regulator of sigma E activity